MRISDQTDTGPQEIDVRPFPRRRRWLIPAFVAAVAFIGGVASNLVASDIQEAVKPYRRWVWVIFAVALVVAIIAAIRGENSSKDTEASSASANAQGAVAAGAITNTAIVTGSENPGIHHSQVQGPVQMVGRQEVHHHYHLGPEPPRSLDQLSSQPFSQKAEVSRNDAIHKERRQIFSLPFQRNRFFTGRDDTLSGLYMGFKAGETAQALSGMPGVGKTQTALEYAYRHQKDYQIVLWAKAHSRETLVTDFTSIAGLLNLPEKNASDQSEAVGAMKRWLENNDGWLLILDNADDLVMAREFIPSKGTGHVLLTTRAPNTRPIAARQAVEIMEPQEGALFLLRRLGGIKKDKPLESAPEKLRDQAEALSRVLDGLPLALDQAAAFIEETPSTLEEYQTLYQIERKELLKRRGRLAEDHPSVTVTFSLAFKKVADANPAAADLLRLCAFLESDSIPEEIFAVSANKDLLENSSGVLSPKLSKIRFFRIFFRRRKSLLGEVLGSAAESSLTLTDTIGEAARFSLLRRHPEARTVSLHRLVQAVLRDEMDSDTRRMWAERAVRAVNEVFPDSIYVNWALCERLIPHAQLLALSIVEYGCDSLEAVQLMNRAGFYLIKRAQYVEAEPLYKRVLAIREKALGPEHPDVADSLDDLAHLYNHQGKFTETEPLLKRALAIREKTLGPEHPDVVRILNNFAQLYHDQDRHLETEPILKRALAITEKALGPEHPDVARSLDNLARLYNRQGKYAEAEPILKRALAIREKAFGSEHPGVARSLDDLADLYNRQGKYAEGERLMKRALAITEKALGPEHPDVVRILNNFAQLYHDQDRHLETELILKRALAITEKALGPEHPDVARSLDNLAHLYCGHLNKYVEAESLYERALAITEKKFGPEHPGVADILDNLAGLYDALGRYAEAAPLHKRALNIREKALGPEHPDTVIVLEKFAALLRKMSREDEADEIEARGGA